MTSSVPCGPLQRFARYGVVGAAGVGVNMGVFWLLSSGIHASYLVSSPLATEAALCMNYVLHIRWTFADRCPGAVERTSFLRFQVVSFGGLLINLAVLHVLAGTFGVPALAANLAGIALATAWNFLLSLGWTWGAPGDRGSIDLSGIWSGPAVVGNG